MGYALFNLTDKRWITPSGWQSISEVQLRTRWDLSDHFAPLEWEQSYPSQQGKAIRPRRIQLRKLLPTQECWNIPFPQNATQILVLSLPNQRWGGIVHGPALNLSSRDTPVATLCKIPSAYLLLVSGWSCSFVFASFQLHFFLLLVEMWNS